MNAEPTVLIIEDNEDDALLVQRALRKLGITCRMRVLGDGDTAVQYLAGEGEYSDRERHPLPTLLLLDLKLPRRNGFEIHDWVRSKPGLKRLPIVVLTSSKEDVDLNRAYDLGANSYLVKRTGMEATTELMRLLSGYWLLTNETPTLK